MGGDGMEMTLGDEREGDGGLEMGCEMRCEMR